MIKEWEGMSTSKKKIRGWGQALYLILALEGFPLSGTHCLGLKFPITYGRRSRSVLLFKLSPESQKPN
jgi:hypothetical protein